MASSSSYAIKPKQRYDVFLSFRGEDTRHSFTSYLHAALQREKIETYMDDKKLERGDEIAPALLKARSFSQKTMQIRHGAWTNLYIYWNANKDMDNVLCPFSMK
jgi:hypothetical protein